MNQTIELTLADGRELDIPPDSILMFEEMTKGQNEHFPDAKAFVRYAIGAELRSGILKTKFEDLVFELGINAGRTRWLKLTKQTGERVAVLAHTIVSRMALDEGCQIDVLIGQTPETLIVKESRREIKKWTERSMGPAPSADTLVEAAPAEDNDNG